MYKDAVFISPHKFVGGVQTPGILIAKKSLFSNPVPSGCGGGSVFFVSISHLPLHVLIYGVYVCNEYLQQVRADLIVRFFVGTARFSQIFTRGRDA